MQEPPHAAHVPSRDCQCSTAPRHLVARFNEQAGLDTLQRDELCRRAFPSCLSKPASTQGGSTTVVLASDVVVTRRRRRVRPTLGLRTLPTAVQHEALHPLDGWLEQLLLLILLVDVEADGVVLGVVPFSDEERSAVKVRML